MKEQIEEMTFILSNCCDDVPIQVCENTPCNRCRAEHIYNAGYRKQSDVIDEFVKRLLDAFPEPHRGGNLCPAIYYDDYRYIIEELAEEMKGGAE